MTIEVLVCRTDGTQAIEEREVAADWLPAADEQAKESAAETSAGKVLS